MAEAERAERAAQEYVLRHNAELNDIVRLAQSLWEYPEARPNAKTVARLQRLVTKTSAIRKLRNLADRSRVDPVQGPKLRRPTKRMKAMADLAEVWDALANLHSAAPREEQAEARPSEALVPQESDLTHPVCVADIARNLPRQHGGGRSDKLGDKLRRMKARMQKLAGRWYVEREDAQRLLPAYRKWATRQTDE
ncbi:MAG: hypothetical protein PVJ57_09065 [Phycisphaerae bacterium]